MERPTIKIGDLVKLSKKGKQYPREFPKDKVMLVAHVEGDGSDRTSIITCRVEIEDGYKFYRFYRSELWYCRTNAFVRRDTAIKNNDGRDKCLACGKPTQTVNDMSVCVNTKCEWYRN